MLTSPTNVPSQWATQGRRGLKARVKVPVIVLVPEKYVFRMVSEFATLSLNVPLHDCTPDQPWQSCARTVRGVIGFSSWTKATATKT
jgi:hypothetical protein